jgi:hypothetical protein
VPIVSLDALADAFLSAQVLRDALRSLGTMRPSWRGEGVLRLSQDKSLLLAIRAETVMGRNGALVGFVLSFADQSDAQQALTARHQLERSLQPAGREADDIVRAILTNASVAAMDIADGQHDSTTAPQLHEVGQSAHRAADLYRRMRNFASNP